MFYRSSNELEVEGNEMTMDSLSSKDFKNDLKLKYEGLHSLYEQLVDEVLYILKSSIDRTNIKVHSLGARDTKIKTFESFYQKVLRHQITVNQFDSVDDIAGVRVICLYRSDLEKIGKTVTTEFNVLKADTSRTRTETPFGYSSDHYTVTLSKECKGPRYDRIKNLRCEIQVRTILMDAWASVSHHLDYKQETDIPSDLRTDFNAVSGLFYVADTHFELFKEGVVKARANLMKTIQEGTFDLDQEINLESLTAFIDLRFPERSHKRGFLGGSDVLSELRKFGYKNLRPLDEKVQMVLPMIKEYEMAEFKLSKWEPQWAYDGLVRTILDLADDRYFKSRLSSTYKSITDPHYLETLVKYRRKVNVDSATQ